METKIRRIVLLLTCVFCTSFCLAQGTLKRNKAKDTSHKTQVIRKSNAKSNVVRNNTSQRNSNYQNIHATNTSKISYSNGVLYVNGVKYDFVKVEGGTFTMGDTQEMLIKEEQYSLSRIAHVVTLTNDYYIGKTEVTQALWKGVMGNNPSKSKGNNKPVENISWYDCEEFVGKLNSITGLKFRLPTEAEWEFAARGGNKSNHYRYSGSNKMGDIAWYSGNSGGTTHDVATKQPNELGIYDMTGNVSEWCEDFYGEYDYSLQRNPTGPISGDSHIWRGGDYYSAPSGYDDGRSSGRHGSPPNLRIQYQGFRLALSE